MVAEIFSFAPGPLKPLGDPVHIYLMFLFSFPLYAYTMVTYDFYSMIFTMQSFAQFS